jgi:molybdenum cofactor cytidylyltransferase
LGERSVLEHVIAALTRAGVNRVLAVVTPNVPELLPLAQSAGANVLLLPNETPDMRATVEAGLRWLEERYRPSESDAWLLAPADHPTLDESVVRQLIAARGAYPERSVMVPTYQGRRGHPTLIGWSHVAGIRNSPAAQGINAYLRSHGDATFEVPVASAHILDDLDTPADYERLLRDYASGTANG